MKTILIKFAGPLQSWGTNSHFETRHTDMYPSKSAVIGLIAACMGYKRNEDQKINALNNISFAVRVDQPGNIVKDYHTAHKYKSNGECERTYVTNRYYIEDGVFVAAVGSDNGSIIDTMANALTSPYFQPYMGRRSLPLNYDSMLGVKEKDIITALKEEKWHASEWYRKKNYVVSLDIYADIDLLNTYGMKLRKDNVISFSDKARKYGFRREGKISMEIQNDHFNVMREHDAFNAVEG